MEKLSRMLTICLILFASMESTAMGCYRAKKPELESDWDEDGDGDEDGPVSSKKPKMAKTDADADPTWTLNVHFTTWTRNGTFRVNKFFGLDTDGYRHTKTRFKDDRNMLDWGNNVTVVFETKINSTFAGVMDVELGVDNYPYFFTATKITFHRVRTRTYIPYEDAVVPVISSSGASDPFASKVRGICYISDCEPRLYYGSEKEYEYDLFVQCDRVQPYPSADVLLSNFTAENYYKALRDDFLASTDSLQAITLEFRERAKNHLNLLIDAYAQPQPQTKGRYLDLP